MRNKIVLFSVLAVFALFAVIAVPSVSAPPPYPANAIYLEPEDSGGLFCEDNTLVEVRVNANVVTTGVQTSICFDPTCVNITDVDFTGSAWPPLVPPGWTHWGDHVTLIGTNFVGVPAGDNLFATIRLHCVKEEYCLSDLEFRNVNVLDVTPAPIDITAYNGTFRCIFEPIPSIDVNKTVLDPETGEWVDKINASVCDTVTFNSTIHNNGTCCDLTNIVVMDTMSDSLEYVDATPVPDAVIPNPDGTTTLEWFLPGPLAPCESRTFLIDAHVTKCGEDWNKQNATADTCNNDGPANNDGIVYAGEFVVETVYDEDYAYVNVPPKPSIEVNKTVWNGTAWVEETTAEISDIVRFRCEMHNNGTCCNLTNLIVTDILSDSLEYADNATVHYPNCTTVPLEPMGGPNEFRWEFPCLVLEPCQTITIEFDARVIDYGYDCNVQNATAICEETDVAVSDEDEACINVPGKPDLNVTSININPNCTKVVDEIFVNESNEICAVIHNDGPGDVTEPFDVCFAANGVNISCVNVAGGLPLHPCENVTVCINWTPNCTDYPVSTLYPVYSGIPVTLNVTADCNCTDCPTCPTGGKIDEVDEYNNTLSKDTFVYNNGYKSKNFDCNLTEEPLTLFEEDQFYGGVVYNVSGTKNYPFDPDENDTRIHHIDIPAGMTVKKARLYVYWYDYWGNPPPGCLANLSVNFSGTIVPLDAAYTDQKGFGTFNTPKGTYAYDVTPQVTPGSIDYTVIVTNIDPTNQTTLLGEMLLVVYEDPTGLQNHTHLWIMEGCDYLMASHGTYQYCVDVNEATATVTFPGPIPPAVTGAKLITVVAQGMAPGSDKLFNGAVVATDVWDTPSEAYHGSKINVDEENVAALLAPSDNTVGFRDTGTNGMQASNAILILEKGVVEEPDLIIDDSWMRERRGKCKVYFVVKNIGPATAPRDHYATLYVDGIPVEEKRVRRDLGTGEQYESSFRTEVSCMDDIKVCADNTHVVNESDETNNCWPPKTDLNVTSININPTCSKVVDEIFVNESNEICAVIHNDGPGDVTEPFDVCFAANGVNISCVNVAGGLPLHPCENVTVCINWTPNCTDYPVSTLYPVYSGIPVTLNVTADCNCTDCPTCPTGGKIDEIDEDNNTLSKDTFVYNNGYKSKNFDCNLTEEPLTLFEEDQFYGGVVYNVSGTKNYPFDPDETDTRVHHIDIPAGMTVKKARLYVYWYDYWGNPPPGCLPNLRVNFSGTIVPLDAAYTDQKGFGTYNTPKGTYAYDVTPQVTPGSNDYTVIVTNIDPTNQTTLLGEMLLVVYEDPTGLQDHIHLWIMEGCDYLMASHGTYQYCVDVNESTATVTFPGPIPPATTGARLITVVAQGMAPGSDKLFNGAVVATDVWDAPSEAYPGSKINVDEENVAALLAPSDNTVGFRDTGTNGMQASNAILILEKVEEPDLVVEKSVAIEDGTFTVSYTVTNIGYDPADESTTCKFVNGELMESQTCPELGSGESCSGAFDPEPCPCGETLNVTVCADNDNNVTESDETNNCEINWVVCGMPDLEVQKWVENVDGTFIVHYTVTNTGDCPANASTTCKYVDGEHIVAADQLCPPLDPGDNYHGTFDPEPCPSGTTINVTICADNYNNVTESDETNNCEVNFVECPNLPDLVIDDIWTREGRDGCKVHFVVKNIGTATAPKGHYATLYVDVDGDWVEIDPKKKVRRALRPDKTYKSSFRTRVNCEALIKVCADNTNVVVESDEANNCEEYREPD